jgi:hypothetical protein
MSGTNTIDQVQQQQSAQLGQQAASEEQRRKHQKGGVKSPIENLIPLIPPEWEMISSIVGNIFQAANLIPLTTAPGIAHALKIQTSLWKDGTFVAKNDLLSALDHMKQAQTKEDLVTSEKQKFDQDQHSLREANESHKHQQQHQNQDDHSHQRQQQQQQDHDDSHRNYAKQQQMADNQRRMNVTNKNSDDYDMIRHHLDQQHRVVEEAKHQSQLIESINRKIEERKRRR